MKRIIITFLSALAIIGCQAQSLSVNGEGMTPIKFGVKTADVPEMVEGAYTSLRRTSNDDPVLGGAYDVMRGSRKIASFCSLPFDKIGVIEVFSPDIPVTLPNGNTAYVGMNLQEALDAVGEKSVEVDDTGIFLLMAPKMRSDVRVRLILSDGDNVDQSIFTPIGKKKYGRGIAKAKASGTSFQIPSRDFASSAKVVRIRCTRD